MTIKEKILQILKDKGVTEYKFYKKTGVSRGTLSNNSGLNAETLVKFFDFFPEIDANEFFKQKNSPNEVSNKNILSEEINQVNDLKKDYEIENNLFSAQQKTISILEREVQDLRTDKKLLQRIIEVKL